MLPFGVTIPATVPQGSEIPEGIMNNHVYMRWTRILFVALVGNPEGKKPFVRKRHGPQQACTKSNVVWENSGKFGPHVDNKKLKTRIMNNTRYNLGA
jgi:hypothetical protein